MKRFILLLISIVTTGCCNYDHDYSFPAVFNRQLKHYAINDTIYFKSNLNDLDTISIAGFDSTVVCGSVFYPPQKEIGLMINDLPVGDGKEDYYKRRHALVILNKYNKNSYLYIRYRDFMEMLELEDLEGKGDVITIHTKKKQSLKPENIIEVQWSLSKGLLGYTKLNGETYKRQ
jgi:hypothetical protein